jgi:hypothetical protein
VLKHRLERLLPGLYGELSDRERTLQNLVAKLLGAQKEERRWVAYEVRDGLAQVEVAAHQNLRARARRHPRGGARQEGTAGYSDRSGRRSPGSPSSILYSVPRFRNFATSARPVCSPLFQPDTDRLRDGRECLRSRSSAKPRASAPLTRRSPRMEPPIRNASSTRRVPTRKRPAD